MPGKKIRCSANDCKEAAQRIVGDCSFCNGHFCGKHRLLEDHKCSGLEDVSSHPPHPPLPLKPEAVVWLRSLHGESNAPGILANICFKTVQEAIARTQRCPAGIRANPSHPRRLSHTRRLRLRRAKSTSWRDPIKS